MPHINIAGPYSVSYGGSVVGIAEDGIDIEYIPLGDDMRGDNLGQTLQDVALLGCDVFANFVLCPDVAAWAAVQTMLQQVGSLGDMSGVAGRLVAQLSTNTLLFTKIGGSTTATPGSISGKVVTRSSLLPLSSSIRRMPFRFQFVASAAGILYTVG